MRTRRLASDIARCIQLACRPAPGAPNATTGRRLAKRSDHARTASWCTAIGSSTAPRTSRCRFPRQTAMHEKHRRRRDRHGPPACLSSAESRTASGERDPPSSRGSGNHTPNVAPERQPRLGRDPPISASPRVSGGCPLNRAHWRAAIDPVLGVVSWSVACCVDSYRIDPDLAAEELRSLSQLLDFHRATLISKVKNLSAKQLPHMSSARRRSCSSISPRSKTTGSMFGSLPTRCRTLGQLSRSTLIPTRTARIVDHVVSLAQR
jgi:hypothetical protein